jgi:hypothetical protein
MEVERLRAQVLATKPILRVTEPVDHEHAAFCHDGRDLDAVLARLREVRPRSLA